MRVFIKRFWGFDPVYWPVVSFGLRGSLETLLEASAPSDLMTLVGTRTDQTDEQEQGKLLGLAEFGRRTLHSRSARPKCCGFWLPCLATQLSTSGER